MDSTWKIGPAHRPLRMVLDGLPTPTDQMARAGRGCQDASAGALRLRDDRYEVRKAPRRWWLGWGLIISPAIDQGEPSRPAPQVKILRPAGRSILTRGGWPAPWRVADGRLDDQAGRLAQVRVLAFRQVRPLSA